jgi:PleD family two-component response regulator
LHNVIVWPLRAVIIMITGEQDRTLMKRAFEIGVEFFLFKPVERNGTRPRDRGRVLSAEQEPSG